MTVTVNPVANLAVQNLSGPSYASQGQTIPVGYRVTNTGAAAAMAPWTDVVYLSTDNQLDAGDTALRTFTAQLITGRGRLLRSEHYGHAAELR